MVRRRGFKKSGSASQDHKGARGRTQNPKSIGNDGIPPDEEDRFFEGRDAILLDGSDPMKGKSLEDYDDEEEVFALKGIGDSESDAAGSYGEPESDSGEDEEDAEEPPVRAKSSKKTEHHEKGKVTTEEDKAASDEDPDMEERWGKGKSAYYSATVQEVDSDDEEARELEEVEALRLQAKARETITDDDFGLNDSHTLQTPPADAQSVPGPSTAVPLTTAPRTKKSILRQLELSSPEVLALAREWEDIAAIMRRTEVAIAKRTALDPNHSSLGMVHLHHQTLLTYASVLAHYLHVRSTPIPGPTPNATSTAKSVPDKVLERLYQLKHGLSVLEDIGFSALENEEDDDDLDDSELEESGDDYDLEWDEDLDANSDTNIDAILNDIENRGRDEALNNVRRMRNQVVKSRPLTGGKADGETGTTKLKIKISTKKNGKKKAKEEDGSNGVKTDGTPLCKFDLEEPEFGFYSAQASSSSSASKLSLIGAPYDAFGEQTSLDFADLADKNARKKSLKFHMQKIERKSRRREAARLNALGGDDDIPRRDIRREKKAREKATSEAAKKGERGQGGDDLDDGDPELSASASMALAPTVGDKGKKRAHDQMDEGDGSGAEGDDGYCELIKKSKKQAKIDKKAAYDAAVAANKPDFSEDSATGSRSVTRAILKNKGLTPKRSKVIRNPRVKKKLRFEEAKKKVSSKRAVFKGGLASLPGGRYEGEKSGISQVIKSVRL